MKIEYEKVWRNCWACSGKTYSSYAKNTCPYCKGEGGRWAKEQIMLCFGGPLNRKKRTEDEAGKEYLRYNPSIGGKGKHRKPCFLVHKSLTED